LIEISKIRHIGEIFWNIKQKHKLIKKLYIYLYLSVIDNMKFFLANMNNACWNNEVPNLNENSKLEAKFDGDENQNQMQKWQLDKAMELGSKTALDL
jgi:hypothetical protein